MTTNRASLGSRDHPSPYVPLFFGVFVHLTLFLVIVVYILAESPNYAQAYYDGAFPLPLLTRVALFTSEFLYRFGWLMAVFVVPIFIAVDGLLLRALATRLRSFYLWAYSVAVTLLLLLLGGLWLWALRLPLGPRL